MVVVALVVLAVGVGQSAGSRKQRTASNGSPFGREAGGGPPGAASSNQRRVEAIV